MLFGDREIPGTEIITITITIIIIIKRIFVLYNHMKGCLYSG